MRAMKNFRSVLAPPALAVLAGCASAQPAEPARAGAVVNATLNIAGTDYNVDWFLPDGPAAALVTVQHGFTRNCGNVRGTATRLMERGLMGLCVNASMAGGNPALAEALAVTLLSGITAPGGRVLPDQIIVGGHSAGGHFASRLGWKLDASAPQRLAGAVLFDPVAAGASFTTNLMAISAAGTRPVLAVSANPSGCNASNNAYPALRQVRQDAIGAGRDGFVGLQLTDRSTHVDVEGRDTNALGVVACGQGRPQAANTEALRTLAAQWALDQASGQRNGSFYPGGAYVDGLVGGGDARVIE
jgi:pimeloyl-ACP methyl ester carboxylesterase